MTYLVAPLQGLLVLVLNLVAPILALMALPFIKWDGVISTQPQRSGPPVPTVMGDLPWWLSWFQTPDQRFPGDLAIPEVKATFDRWGKWVTSYVWMGFRNPLMGLAAWMGRETSAYVPYDVAGLWQRQDQFGHIWRYTLLLGSVRLCMGYNVYALLDGRFWAAPVFTAKFVD